jgi:mannosyltransferase OCH1-like enzyme
MPMQVSQIFLSDAGDELPPLLKQRADTVRLLHADMDYRLYGLASLRQFIADHFDREVLRAYDKLKPYSYKADLGRYCLLYRLGGWYFDISLQVLLKVAFPPEIACLAYRDIQFNSRTSWACNGAIIFSRPGNEVFKLAIDHVIQNCRNEYYGITALCPTGPTVLGRAFAVYGARREFVFGDLTALTPNRDDHNFAYVLPNGLLHAFRKKSGGAGLALLGAQGTDNYNQLYDARNVYDPGHR